MFQGHREEKCLKVSLKFNKLTFKHDELIQIESSCEGVEENYKF